MEADEGSEARLPRFNIFPKDTAPVRVLAPEFVKLPEVRSPVVVKAVKLGEEIVDIS